MLRFGDDIKYKDFTGEWVEGTLVSNLVVDRQGKKGYRVVSKDGRQAFAYKGFVKGKKRQN